MNRCLEREGDEQCRMPDGHRCAHLFLSDPPSLLVAQCYSEEISLAVQAARDAAIRTEAVLTWWCISGRRRIMRQFVVRYDEGLSELLDIAAELCRLADRLELALYVHRDFAAFVWDWWGPR